MFDVNKYQALAIYFFFPVSIMMLFLIHYHSSLNISQDIMFDSQRTRHR
jgi:hypothetical protein